MIIRHHGGLELFAIIWMFMTLVAGSQNGTESTTDTPLASNTSEIIVMDNSTVIEIIKELENQTVSEDNITNSDNIKELVKSHRRAPRYDTADSVPWVRIYNRPPGVKTESYFNYDTRSNTSAHTSGEGWDSLRKDKQNAVVPINRRESKTRVQDLLRVKSKIISTPSPKRQDTEETNASTNAPETTTNPPVQTSTTPALVKNDTLNKGYIIWSSNDGVPAGGWTFDDQKNKVDQKLPSVEDIMPKDGTKWKVIGEGGDDGWQVVDDKGDVEWKIEYDDGEWRVTSTGDIPADAEWVDPEYVWGPEEGSLSEEDEYNSWSADDYAYSPWVDPVVYVRGAANHTWPNGEVQNQIAKSSIQTFTSGEKTANAIKDFLTPKEPTVFGARRKIPEKDTSSSQDRTTESKSDFADDSLNTNDETPQADQVVAKGKSWISTGPAIKTGQKWVQGYGVKSWEVDNTGKNSGFGGETWITRNKDFPNTPWVPKQATGSIPETPKPVIPAIQPVPQNVNIPDNPIHAWGTGYGSKTWKGNEWDSNVVWKTGFGGALPWTTENGTSWKFPDEGNDDTKEKDKKNIVWSQPLPSEDSEPTSSPKPTNLPEKSLNNIRIKWPTKPPSSGNLLWKTPPRRTEDESWGDDSSEGGVIWKDQVTEAAPTDAPTDSSSKTIGHLSKGWQTGGWVTNQNVVARPVSFSWKGNPPQKTSNLISVNWKSDEIVTDAPPAPTPVPVAWNQGQWPGGDQDNFPTWIFGGCKLTIKCGSSESDSSEDESVPTTPQDTSEDDSSSVATDAPTTTTAIKGWPVNQFKGKSWKPPTKSWKPPTKSWKPPKKNPRPSTPKQPPPTMPDTPPPTPPMSWKKPPPPPKTMWKKPPPGWKQPPPGWKQPPPGWNQPPPGWKQPPPGWKQPPPGWKQPPPGWKQPPPGWKQPPPIWNKPPPSWNKPPPSWKQPSTPPTTLPSTEATTTVSPSMSWKSPPPPPPPSLKWKKPVPGPTKSWKPPPTKSWKPPPTKSWKPPTYPGKSWQPSIATPAPDTWSTPTKPDCKESSETTQETPAPNVEDEDVEVSPPQIIIITKLPTNQKGTPPPSTDKWDTRDDRKNKKPPGKSWTFPSRKVSQKSNKNKKETVGRMINKWPARPGKISKPANKFKGWPKGIPMPNFTWPANAMRRWTTKRPSYLSTWKPPKYMRSKAWRQMLKKWMKARM